MPRPLTLVLTAAPGSGAVTGSVVKTALGSLPVDVAETRWLSPADAWEARFVVEPDLDQAALRDTIMEAIGAAPVDVNIVAGDAATRRKQLLAADMESTIIEQELIDEMAGLVGCRAEIAAITEAAMRGEVGFESALVRRVALFAGLEESRLEAILARATFMPGAETLLATMRAHGARTVLVSGGFTIFAERIAGRLGFHTVHANVLETNAGRLSGRVREPILGPEGKADVLLRLAAEAGLAASQTLAVGDGANDLAMVAKAGLGVAFRAKPVLAAEARELNTGAVITHGDLTALLYLQGYDRESLCQP